MKNVDGEPTSGRQAPSGPAPEFSLTNVPVVVSASGREGTASIVQDDKGHLTIRVAQDPEAVIRSVLSDRRATISSVPPHTPSILIENASRGSAHLGPDGCHQDFWASRVLIRSSELHPTAVVAWKYYLTGLNFSDQVAAFQAGGIHWRLALLDDFVATSRRIDAEDDSPITAVLSSEPVSSSRAVEVDEAASLVLLLLSFAAGGFVRAVRIVQEHEGAVATTELRPGGSAKGFSLPPILLESAVPGVVTQFIESSYQPAATVSEVLPLRRLIRTLLDLRAESVVHTKGLLAANFLEVVRYHYALRALVPAGRAEIDGDGFCRRNETGKRRHLSFADILGVFAEDKGLTGWKLEYKDFRNRVVHGDEIDGATLLDQYARVMDVAHFCDTVILALLEWDRGGGKYVPCNDWSRNTSTSIGVNVKPFAR